MFVSINFERIKMTENVGLLAGSVWAALNENGSMTSKDLKKAAKIKTDKDLYLALGWLLREDKVVVTEEDKVLTLKSSKMKRSKIENNYSEAVAHAILSKDAYSMYALEGLSRPEISKKLGVSPTTVWRLLRTFEAENPQLSEQMKKKGKDVSPEDYRKLLTEINNLKAELKKEKLRADFYEEMVAFGEEVYGMDLKKAGIK